MSYSENDIRPATTNLGTVLVSAGLEPTEIIATAEAVAPNKDTKKMADTNKPAAPKKSAAAKDPIVRLYGDPAGKKVVLGDLTFLIGEADNGTRKFEVVRAKGDELLGRFIFQHELDYEELYMKAGSNVDVFDDKVKLHTLLRPLAVEAGLAKAAAPKPKKAEPSMEERLMRDGATGLDYVAPRGIRRQGTSVMEQSISRDALPVGNFGIERLLKAPADVKVGLGGLFFLIEEGDEGQRRYKCVKAPDDEGLGLWVTDREVRNYTQPYIPEKMGERVAGLKRKLHATIRNAGVDAGLIEGEYAHEVRTDAIKDPVIVKASIRDGIEGRYIVEALGESAVLQIAWGQDRRGHDELQLIMIGSKAASLAELKPGVRVAHKLFMSRLRPEKLPDFICVWADFLEEAVF